MIHQFETPTTDPVLKRTLVSAGLPLKGNFQINAGWVSRAWIGDEFVVRINNGPFRDAYRHEVNVVALIGQSCVPHARIIAHGDGPDGIWSISERLPGRTLHEVWPEANTATRRSIIESLGDALKCLHEVPVTDDLLPPWLKTAFDGGPRLAYHPPVIKAAPGLLEDANRASGRDSRLLANVRKWIEERLPLFGDDTYSLVHGDLHGSNIIVDQGRVTGIIDFAETLAQPADVELDKILRWCARSDEYPPTPDGIGLNAELLANVPGWLRGAYPDLFAAEALRERLLFYDLVRELALYAHHPHREGREIARRRLIEILGGHNHLDLVNW